MLWNKESPALSPLRPYLARPPAPRASPCSVRPSAPDLTRTRDDQGRCVGRQSAFAAWTAEWPMGTARCHPLSSPRWLCSQLLSSVPRSHFSPLSPLSPLSIPSTLHSSASPIAPISSSPRELCSPLERGFWSGRTAQRAEGRTRRKRAGRQGAGGYRQERADRRATMRGIYGAIALDGSLHLVDRQTHCT